MDILLLIPPMTQLNTPYPATAYLKGFLEDQGVTTHQGDLGLDLALKVFSKEGLKEIFDQIDELSRTEGLDIEVSTMLRDRASYESTIEHVVTFLQNQNPTLAYRIAKRQFLPEGHRFHAAMDLEWHFGVNSVQDQARYLCSLYLEDLVDMIAETVGPHFGISRYAERIARTASSFDGIENALLEPTNQVDQMMLGALASYFEKNTPSVVGFSVPFSGNLYGALKAGQWIKANHPNTKILLGGGYANTELRDLRDPRVFDYVDYITLDDGEGPVLALLKHLEDPEGSPHLKRTFLRKNGLVSYVNDREARDFGHAKLPAPSYKGLKLDQYLSMFDMPNPMHRLWNDGRWNKLTMAHGCYWKKCSFCDVTLDYISRFEETPAKDLVDKMEALIEETGETGFHFVDEAAPPLAMRDMALEILRRGLQVTWWANIRFEKTFSADLCKLLAASGCIAVTGGLEVASDRLLELMEKGVTIEQVARVCSGFRDAGILVHAYLMYGFPTQTEQETIDSLEVVRQLFEHGVIQSGFWHQFAMTAHSPVGKDPEKYKVVKTGPEFQGFANNDLFHDDPTGCRHEDYSDGLNKALYNYMHDNGIDFPLQEFFDFPIPLPTTPKKRIAKALKVQALPLKNWSQYNFYLHRHQFTFLGKQKNRATLEIRNGSNVMEIQLPAKAMEFLLASENEMRLPEGRGVLASEWIAKLAESVSTPVEKLIETQWWKTLREQGLWMIRG